jgi:DNA processing protein
LPPHLPNDKEDSPNEKIVKGCLENIAEGLSVPIMTQIVSHYVPKDTILFPRKLAEIPDPPRGIFLSGHLPPESALMVAIVGTRRATPAGKSLARSFACTLARRGIVIVSGLAFGIDAAAHEGALDAKGLTLAVLPCGLDRTYPRSHETLTRKILENGGALISEYSPGTDALPYRFLERNRIVSGLARGTLIIEAPERSGALATARFTAEQGRDCFVVPGPVTHPNFMGSHQLIRKGAELVTCPEEILETWGLAEETTSTKETIETTVKRWKLSDDETKIFRCLSETNGAAEVDKIITTANVQPQAANIAISFLLMKGLIKEVAGGYMVS